jgi:hexokinase
VQGILPDGREEPVTRQQFFGRQAQLLHSLGAPVDLPLGYCFSYPAAVERSGDARLVRWTKGIQVTGVEGELVGQALREAVGGSGGVKVLNDTVAALLGGALVHPQFEAYIGLIVGTGTNMAAFMPATKIPKVTGWSGDMAVNLESGNFAPPHLTHWDEALDRDSLNPGKQRYEKAVSGYYLPQLFARLCPELAVPEHCSSQLVVEWADRHGDEQPAQAARWLLQRSADLVAAGLAAVSDHLGARNVAVEAEGGLFWKATGYHQRVAATLKRLLGDTRHLEIVQVEDVNLMGAAAAALAPA